MQQTRTQSQVEAERSAISALLDDPSLVAGSQLAPEMFSSPERRAIFLALQDLAAKGLKIDPITIIDRTGSSEGGGIWTEFETISYGAGVMANYLAYERIVMDAHQGDQVRQIGTNLLEDPQGVEGALTALSSIGVQSRWERSTDELIAASDDLLARMVSGIAGVSTGISELDSMLVGGYVPGRLVVVGGRPAMGKTAFTTSSCLSTTEACGIISSEMAADQLGLRMLSCLSTVPLNKAMQGRLGDTELSLWASARDELRERQVLVNDRPGINMDQVAAQARKWSYSNGLRVLFIDHLQRLDGDPRKDRTANIRDAIKAGKELARRLDICVVMLSQVNRQVENRDNKRPTMADLDGAGTIEAEADAVVMLYRPVVYDKAASPREAELILVKNRHGAVGTIPAAYEGGTTTFTSGRTPHPF